MTAADGSAEPPGGAAPATFAGALRAGLVSGGLARPAHRLLLAMVVVVAGAGVLNSWGTAVVNQASPYADPAATSLAGLYLGQVLAGVLGVAAARGATGARAGLTVAARGTVLAAVTLAAGLVASCAAFFAGQALLAGSGLGTGIAHPDVARAVAGGALYLAASALLGFGTGLLLTSATAGAVLVLVLQLVVPYAATVLPLRWQDSAARWVPALAGARIWMTGPRAPDQFPLLRPWPGFALLCGYAGVAVCAGAVAARRRSLRRAGSGPLAS